MEKLLKCVCLLSLLSLAFSFCPDNCVCDDYRLETSCIQTNLEVMPMTLNPSIRTLILKFNNFHTVDASFNFYPELEFVDLSSNHIVSIPDRAFSNQRRLVELRINRNKISKLSERTFSGLGKLQVLDLEENIIDQLPKNVFKHLKHVKELNLRSNRIGEIATDAFGDLHEITVLDLSDNLLESIPTYALRKMHNLAELNLAKNNIKLIVDQSFFNLLKLSVLDLSGNKIERIHEKAFSRVNSVRRLNLQDNELYKMPSHALKRFQNMEYLNIGQNKFRVIDDSDFLNLPRLKTLDISGCSSLQEVSANAFSMLSDLENIKIAFNKKLNMIHPEAFGKLSKLNHLEMSNNALSSINPNLVPWMSLASLDLSGNPWSCDCQTIFLKNVIINTVNNSDSIPIVRCWNPPALRDRDIAFLNMDCEIVQSPKTDQTVRTIDLAAVIAVIISLLIVVVVVILFVIIKSRKSVKNIIKSTFEKDNDYLPPSEKIFQPNTYHEPRYVSHYTGAQTLQPVITINPYQQSLVRNDQYFLTLEGDQKEIYQVDLRSDKIYKVRSDGDSFQENGNEERIYHVVKDTFSDI